MDYKERLLIEFRQLTERITLLNSFINSSQPTNIDKEQLELMHKQHECMCQYEEILFNRILMMMK